MSLSYEVTNWENGKTVLKAEHLRKIEKGITDIISENDAIYKDEDIRKSNEKQRQEEHSRKMNEVSEVVSDIQKDYDSLQKIIIDENASANLQNQINQTNSQLEHNANKLKSLNTLTEFSGINEAIENGGEIILPNGANNEIISPMITKQFILKGQGEQFTTLNPSGNTTPFATNKLYSMGFRDLKINCENLNSDYVISYGGSSNRINIDNVDIVNIQNNGIIAKSGMASIFRDSYVYGKTGKHTGNGIQLGVTNGDWQNINTFSNNHIAWFNNGLLLKNSVLNNINGCHIYQCDKAISIETNPPNPTRDININGCYFEQNKTGIYANPTGRINNLNIENSYFACDTLMDLKKIDGLKISDCSYAINYEGQTGNVLLSDISNLVISNKNNMTFKTHSGNPIIFGDNNNCENMLPSSNKTSSYLLTGLDNANPSDSLNEYNGKLIGSFSLNNNSIQHFILKRIVYSSSNGLAGLYMSNRLVGFSGMFRPSTDCNIKIFIGDDTQVYKYKIFEQDLQANVFNKIEGVGITGEFIDKNNIQIQYLITKKQANDIIKLEIDEIQLWFDYYKRPKYINNETNYPIVSRPHKIFVSDLNDARGLFVLSGEEIIKTNSSVFTTETINKWLVNKTGYIKNGLSQWKADTSYKKGEYCYTSKGVLLQCIKNGSSGSVEPTPKQIAEVIQENSIMWLAITSSDVSSTTIEKTYI